MSTIVSPSPADTAPTVDAPLIPSLIGDETCDQCGTSKGAQVRASHLAYKGALTIAYCSSHARVNVDALVAKGWGMNPMVEKFTL